jgi:hypothetical protein
MPARGETPRRGQTSPYVRSRQSSARLSARGRNSRTPATRAGASIRTTPRSPAGRRPATVATTAMTNARQTASTQPKPDGSGELPPVVASVAHTAAS